MSDAPNESAAAPPADRTTDLGRQVAERLREVAERLTTRAVSDTDLEAALAQATALRDRLDGPRRPRWFDDAERSDASRREAFHEIGPLRGRSNPVAPPLDLDTVRRPDGRPGIRGTATLGEAYEGPPHGVHGGFVAAMFDEVLGATQTLVETPGVTGRLTVHYRHLTPLGERLTFEGWIHRHEGRRLVSKATCHAEDGTLCAEAEGLFLQVDFEALQSMMQARRG